MHIVFTNVKQSYKHNPKVSPFGISLIKKRQIKLEDAGTIDHSVLRFNNVLKLYIKKNAHKQSPIKNTI